MAEAGAAPSPAGLVGGNGPTVLDRVLAFGDAWFPNYGPVTTCWTGHGAAGAAPTARSRCMVMGVPADARVLDELEQRRRAPGGALAPIGGPRPAWSAL